ncbi:hypothetical protein [Nocardia sp. NPDC058666]|uniref:hypothetical protein n=1 Tax=unclassified Nocardia TaxID=2637762 RepID=UPI0036464A6A
MTGPIPMIPGVIGVVAAQQPATTPEMISAFNAAASTQRKAATIAAGTAGQDPAYIKAMEEFANLSHADIHARAQQMQPGVMQQTAETWKAISTALTFNIISVTTKVNATIARGWEGQTAEAIKAATHGLTGRLTELQNVTQSVAWRVEAAAFGAEVVKAQVQAPPTASSPAGIPGAEPAGSAVAAAQEANERWQAAIWTMRNNYVPTYEPAGQGVPMFPTSNGLGGNDIPVGTGGGGAAATSGSPNGTGTGDGTAAASDPEQSAAAGDSVGAGSTNDQESRSANEGNGAGTGTDGGTDGTETAAAGAEQPGSGAPLTAGSPGTSQPGNPAGSGSPTAGVSGSGGGSGAGGPGVAVGSPGGAKSVPNPVTPIKGGIPGAAAASSGGTSGRGTAGMHGMSGMGAPGAARQKGDDDEHKGRPELRIHPRNRADLVGPPQGTTPPVIGGSPPERRPRPEQESQ